jgi:uncharacterized membrane protein
VSSTILRSNLRWSTRQRRLQASAWRIPTLYAAFALLAGLTLPRLEFHFLRGLDSTITTSAAEAMYSSIASGMLALTAIVFSLTFVMVQFSATAYSPRLVLWLARDPLISHALGIFMATFLYALAALAWIGRGASGVPLLSVVMVVILLLASVAVFVGLIQRIALLQINRMLAFTGDRGREVVDSLYPPLETPEAGFEPRRRTVTPPTQVLRHRLRPQAVQAIDVERLVSLAETFDVVVEVVAAIGDTLVESTPLLYVYGGQRPVEERALRETIEMGDERTFDQDPKYAIRILVDIAVRALSPAINDPTTAVQALDQISDLLLRLARRRLEIGTFRDRAGRVRVLMPFPSWDDFLRLAFDEIRSYGATSMQVMRRMKALIRDLIPAVPQERRAALEHWQERLVSSIELHFVDPDDRRDASTEDRQGFGVTRPRPAA